MMQKRWLLLAGTLLVSATPSTAARPSAEAPVALGKVPNQYICTFQASVPRGNVRAEAARAAGSGGAILHTYSATIKGFAVRFASGGNHMSAMKSRNPKIARCEQDQYVKALPAMVQGKPGGSQPAESTPWGITRVGGAYGGTVSGKAWVIDSGIDLDHPDLSVDTGRSRSFIRDSSPDDANGHGTHVAGTIAACDNSIGVVGVAPCASVVAVRVLDRRGSGTWSGVIAGIDYVGANGRTGDVANMSLGGGPSDSVDAAVKNAAATGVKFTIAAGNDGADANNYSPARANGANIYTVSAFAQGDKFASFSNFGNPPIEYAEPGVSVYSTYKDAGYATLSGTSMAAPHLAGILLVGSVRSGGTVTGDPDGNPDTIGTR